jgi:hypothetical protein
MPRTSNLPVGRQEKCRAAIPTLDPALKNWIDNVIVPAMVKRWAETNPALEPHAVESREAN